MPTSSANRPDNQIIARAIEGDADAFGQLYDHYVRAIYTYIYYQVSDVHEAEDLTEIVFLKAFEKLPEFRKQKKMINFRAWIYRIARNLVIDHYRTRKPTVNLDPDFPLAEEAPPLEYLVQVDEEIRQVIKAISQLDLRLREVVTMRLINGLSYAETADALGITKNYVRVLQFRALKKLRKELKTAG